MLCNLRVSKKNVVNGGGGSLVVRKRILWVEGSRFKSPVYRKNPPPCIITLRSCVLSQPPCFKDKANTGKSFKPYKR